MNPRVAKLVEESAAAEVRVSTERAELLTAFYRESEGRHPVPVLRALAFLHLCEHRALRIGPHELIVGDRGPGPKLVPTYPELTCHTVEDLRTLNGRASTPYRVDDADIERYEREVIPFWRGRSMRDRVFAQVPREWREAYEAGVFTEFMEQRSPGHTALDGTLYR
ncbi:MAG: hypothetical protein AMXMBFR53_19190 [Gemmatimonadota bacterium]